MPDESEGKRVVDFEPQTEHECCGQVELPDAIQRHRLFVVPPLHGRVRESWQFSVRCADCDGRT